MIRFVKALIATLPAVLFAVPAFADDTITVNWTNSTGSSISLTSSSCQPSGACTFPSIPNGTTRQVVNSTTNTTFLRSMIARYRYYNAGTWKSCQVSVSARGPSSTWAGPGCEPGSFSYSFIKGDGTGTSPKCNAGSVTVDYPTCTFTFNVSMSN